MDVRKLIDESIEAEKSVYDIINIIEKASEMLISSLKNGNKLLICGNGGSASQAQHFAGELVGRFEAERKALPCVSLTTDTSVLTSLGNDYNFDYIFARQVEAIGNKNDILIGISTSGNSQNVIKAIEKAREKEMKILTLVGKDGGKIKELGDVNILIKAGNTARIQEAHLLVLHILAKLIEEKLK